MTQYPQNVWLWRDPEKQWLHKILNHINEIAPSNNDTILLSCNDVADFEQSIPLANYLFNLALKLNLLEDERTIFLSSKDTISSIELHLGRKKKNETSANDVTEEEISNFYNNYVRGFDIHSSDDLISSFKAILKQNNCIDIWNLLELYLKNKNLDISTHLSSHNYLIIGKPCSVALRRLIGILNSRISSIHLETPLDISLHGSPSNQKSDEIKVDVEDLDLDDIDLENEHQLNPGSATEEYVKDIILSFLSLLINSRNELALSKVMISPLINLSHDAFTALKHLSIQKEMPMCQVAISYVTRVRLGGKGYAPASDCPMLPHLKGLELFVDTLNQMQTVIEEESCTSTALKKLINILKRKLLKCDSENLKKSSVENISENLKSLYLNIADILKTRISSSASQICQETLDILYHFINYVNSTCYTDSPEIVFAQKNTKRTPLNLPPLLGYFRSPEEDSCSEANSNYNEDSVQSRISQVSQPAFPSYFHHSESSEASVLSTISRTPTKITFQGCIKESEDIGRKRVGTKLTDICSENSQNLEQPNKKPKRLALGEITNESIVPNEMKKNGEKNNKKGSKISENGNERTFAKPNSKKQFNKEPKKTAKKFKQIQGQGKITNFFITGKAS